jgi:hypothetical protein
MVLVDQAALNYLIDCELRAKVSPPGQELSLPLTAFLAAFPLIPALDQSDRVDMVWTSSDWCPLLHFCKIGLSLPLRTFSLPSATDSSQNK